MASAFPEEKEETGQLRPRKGHDRTWSCDIHGEPIKFYCKDHVIPICHPCATKDHQKPCHLDNIGDVILEKGRKLEDAQIKIPEGKERLETLACKTDSSDTSSTNHLQLVKDKVKDTYDKKLKSLEDKERDEIRLINEEAGEEIRIVNEKRERRIKACKEETEKQQQTMKESEAKLISDIQTICDKVKKKVDELRSKNRHNIDILENMDSKIERLKQDNQTLVNEAPRVIASLDESLNSNVHREVADCLDQIEREVQRVKFVEGEVCGKHYVRIDGYIGKWELIKSIDIPSIVNEPWVRGLISDDEICVRGISSNALYITNISTEHTEKVTEGDSNKRIMSCASAHAVDSNGIVCGKWREDCKGDSLDGCITLYDRKWKVIRDITIPRNTSLSGTMNTVYVDVDRDGMILAGQVGQSNFYIINPADGKIINTVTMKDKMVCGKIQALSSGDIVVHAGPHVLTVISRSGEEKAAIQCDEWKDSQCYVDKLTDTIYITYRDKERKTIAVDQVSPDGNIQAKRIVEYKDSRRDYKMYYISPCLVTLSGNLVACDGNKLFVYKKRFIV